MRTMKRYVGRTVIVNVAESTEKAFTGTLTLVRRDALVLRDAQLIDPRNADLSGQVVIPTHLVVWVQVM